MPQPKMPRGVHVDRATFSGCAAVRMVDSNGCLIYQANMTEAVRASMPSDYLDRLRTILNTVDPVGDHDTPPMGIKLLA